MNTAYEEIIIHTNNKYPVMLCDAFAELELRLPDKSIVITDENVYSFYSDKLSQYDCLVMPAGEDRKQWEGIEFIINGLLGRNAGRDTFILGFGGGVVLDMAGFAASVYKRGCRFAFVATSLLAMADASVGGKNGINYGNLKNLIGVFNQPEWVICDVALLETLPDEEYKSGLGEIVKYAVIADKNLFDYLVTHADAIMLRDIETLNYLIEASIHIKSGFVIDDEYDFGKRQHLNFGHSFGHAIELTHGIQHGIAVAAGMYIAARISELLNVCNSNTVEKLTAILARFRIDNRFPVDEVVWQALINDKKNTEGNIRMILLRNIGETMIYDFSPEELQKLMTKL